MTNQFSGKLHRNYWKISQTSSKRVSRGKGKFLDYQLYFLIFPPGTFYQILQLSIILYASIYNPKTWLMPVDLLSNFSSA